MVVVCQLSHLGAGTQRSASSTRGIGRQICTDTAVSGLPRRHHHIQHSRCFTAHSYLDDNLPHRHDGQALELSDRPVTLALRKLKVLSRKSSCSVTHLRLLLGVGEEASACNFSLASCCEKSFGTPLYGCCQDLLPSTAPLL